MASAPANKENVSPEKDIDCLSDSFQKSLSMNHVDKDGRYFLDLMEKESERLTRLCQGTEQDMANKSLPEDGKRFWDKNDNDSNWYRVRLWILQVYINTSHFHPFVEACFMSSFWRQGVSSSARWNLSFVFLNWVIFVFTFVSLVLILALWFGL